MHRKQCFPPLLINGKVYKIKRTSTKHLEFKFLEQNLASSNLESVLNAPCLAMAGKRRNSADALKSMRFV